MMIIDGLTEHQVKILDELWDCETIEDMQRYLQNKSDEEIQEIVSLREMIVLSHIDEQVEQMGKYPDVEFMMKNLKP